jgi:hypothetical protein
MIKWDTIITDEQKAIVEKVMENSSEDELESLIRYGADMYNKGLFEASIACIIGVSIPAGIMILNRLLRKH